MEIDYVTKDQAVGRRGLQILRLTHNHTQLINTCSHTVNCTGLRWPCSLIHWAPPRHSDLRPAPRGVRGRHACKHGAHHDTSHNHSPAADGQQTCIRQVAATSLSHHPPPHGSPKVRTTTPPHPQLSRHPASSSRTYIRQVAPKDAGAEEVRHHHPLVAGGDLGGGGGW